MDFFKKKKGGFFIAAFLFLFFIVSFSALAQSGEAAEASTQSSSGLLVVINVFRILFALVSLAGLALAVYFGWRLAKSNNEGDEEQAMLMRKYLIASAVAFLIGLALAVLLSFTARNFSRGGGGAGGNGKETSIDSYEYADYAGRVAAAGNRTIDVHYPVPNQKNIPRNASIAITFREAVAADALIDDQGKIKSDRFVLYRTKEGRDYSQLINVSAAAAADGRTFVFTPDQSLGSEEENIWYTVALSSEIKKADGQPLFVDITADIAYYWTFEVGTSLDMESPKTADYFPSPKASTAKNAAIQITFDKPINPLSVIGQPAVLVSNEKDQTVKGTWSVSNLYQTIEFLPENKCVKNLCEEAVSCFVENSVITILAKAASVEVSAISGQKSNTAKRPFDGIVDLSGNSFDGNRNGAGEGPESQSGLEPYQPIDGPKAPGDDMKWFFSVSEETNIKAFTISRITPDSKEAGVNFSAPVEANFTTRLLAQSLKKDNIDFYARPVQSEVFYWLAKKAWNQGGGQAQEAGVINHEDFYEKSDYMPIFNAEVKDAWQNCYFPAAGPQCTPKVENGQTYCCDGETSEYKCGN